MNEDLAIHLAVEALIVTMKVSAPFLLTGLLVGLVVSIFQAATQIQEATLSFIPKIVASGIVAIVAGPWMLDVLTSYAHELYMAIPELAGP
jgi:flagellar biosynthesis protein FliQ